MDGFWEINPRQIYYHLHYLLLLVSYNVVLLYNLFSYMFGLNIQVFIALVLPL